MWQIAIQKNELPETVGELDGSGEISLRSSYSFLNSIIDCLMSEGKDNNLWEDRWLEIDLFALFFHSHIIYLLFFSKESFGGFVYIFIL